MAFGLSQYPRHKIVVPVLVWEAPPETEGGDDWAPTDAGLALTRPRRGEPLLMPVEKVPGRNNPFAMGVTVGRVESNDIIVDDTSVSRFHAWLQHDDRAGAWFVTDAESKNGTWVDGLKLSPNIKIRLNDGATLRFGDASMRFYLPDSLKKWAAEKGSR